MKDIFLLDMDDTLLDFKRAEEVNFFAALGQFGLAANSDTFWRFHAINEALWRAFERGETTREKLKVQRFASLFAEYGIAADPEEVARAYFENFHDICFPFDGALEFLAELKKRGRAYIVTNGSTNIQKRHIADAGFAPYLSGVFISEEIGANKPSVEFASYVETHIENYERRRAVWLGDSLTSDMGCAKNAGVDFILYSPHTMPEAYRGKCAKDYGEVLSIIDEM